MKIDVERRGSPLYFDEDEYPKGLEELVISGSMQHDGQGYFLNFETPSVRQLSSLCFWLERKRPGLQVTKLVPRHLTKEESLKIRGTWSEGSPSEDLEWTIRISAEGISFLMSMQFEWRTQ
tara:strand:+ start:416 stop:778 length:363 start_codon:yes stop_codon:yes gene_type:complete